MQLILVHVLGAMAADTLKSSRQGKILAVFERSFYLQKQAGALVCVGSTQLGCGPLHMLYATTDAGNRQRRRWHSGLNWRQSGWRLIIADDLSFDWRNAVVWHPDPVPATSIRLKSGLEVLARLIEHRLSPDGFGVLIPYLISAALPAYPDPADPVLRYALPAITAVSRWLQQPAQPVPAAAQRLIGLGQGLTPSGDDFFGGLLIALHALGAVDTANRLAGWLLPIAGTATGAISFAHLQCAAAGTGSAVVHDMLAALCRADSVSITNCLAAIGRIGHSSGWDMLTGIVCGCAILATERPAVSGPAFDID
jgi:hypothetical protein